MRFKFFFFLFLSFGQLLLAQDVKDSLDRPATPTISVSEIVLTYYKVRWTPAQWDTLAGRELEMLYLIDEIGEPFLEATRGIEDAAILDSFQVATSRLPYFNPALEAGSPARSLYSIRFTFPAYTPAAPTLLNPYGPFYQMPPQPSYEELNIEQTRGPGLLVGVGLAANAFVGRSSEYFSPGGGMRVDLLFRTNNNIGLGFSMGVYGNKARKDIPIADPREQNPAPPYLYLDLLAEKQLSFGRRHRATVQVEGGWGLVNIVPNENAAANSGYQSNGLDLGVVGNYTILFRDPKIQNYPFNPSLQYNGLNIFMGLRYRALKDQAVSGFMLELGLTWRIGMETLVKSSQ